MSHNSQIIDIFKAMKPRKLALWFGKDRLSSNSTRPNIPENEILFKIQILLFYKLCFTLIKYYLITLILLPLLAHHFSIDYY